jgi:hypothetical protein
MTTWYSSWSEGNDALETAHDAYVDASQSYDPTDAKDNQRLAELGQELLDELGNVDTSELYGAAEFESYQLNLQLAIERFTKEFENTMGAADPVKVAGIHSGTTLAINEAVLKALEEGDSTSFWQSGGTILIGKGDEQPLQYRVAIERESGLGAEADGNHPTGSIEMTAKGGIIGRGTITVRGCPDRPSFSAHIAEFSKKEVVFK